MKKTQKGFTLLELLVVIAIIGILAVVIIASLGAAKDRGSSASVRSQMTNMISQAELYYGTTGNRSYGLGGATPSGNCKTGTSAALFTIGSNSLLNLINGIINDGVPAAKTYCMSNGTAVTNATAWAVAVIDPAVPDGSQAFCVDSLGRSKILNIGANPNTPAAAINAGTASCI